ncbi:GntR family transcriptional regulator [Actinospica sp. MGRD01-02]|uniref:GntR family transcriptional regulator n=1 Tax=Actinospica acidithermotolerans TaxID=2828514 RepID=A0A941IN66_9ACTN|nr:GntR family transcriptional regulator [Actinospica acidithermotolerans]MBR7830728.1 GntR family transcriptional regulator [Actinospica acidithermotolerans]
MTADGSALTPLGGRRRYRDQVGDALRAALIAGELKPGEVYSAPALAARFGVSATPVREAMLDLVREGLVDTMPNKGFRVTEVSERQLDEYTQIRKLIEIPVVVGLIRTADIEQFEALRPQADEIVRAAAKGDLIGYLEADNRLHLALLAMAGNEHLVAVVADLRKRSRLFGLQELAVAGRLEASAREHISLLDALIAGDEEAVRACMEHHLSHVRTLWAS